MYSQSELTQECGTTKPPAGTGDAFERYFQVVPALSNALKDHVYRIRHQVFCEDFGYEPLRTDRRERDDYDTHSLHVLIRSVRTGEFIGCTRIIRARPHDPYYPLPFERVCGAALDRSIIDPAKLPRASIAEASRLAVVAGFRRRKGEEKSPLPISDEDFGTPAQPRFPYITLGLYLATVELARLNGIKTLFVLTERRLASHFSKLGVNVRTIGDPVEHRGTRIPSMMSTADIVNDLKVIFRPLYRAIAEDVAHGIDLFHRKPVL